MSKSCRLRIKTALGLVSYLATASKWVCVSGTHVSRGQVKQLASQPYPVSSSINGPISVITILFPFQSR
ncbi:hypothetical protein Mapa_014914 [Marchantia paleacea]|nr:hypothetical protein Mapa_014914 [Marchantia paleacea]